MSVNSSNVGVIATNPAGSEDTRSTTAPNVQARTSLAHTGAEGLNLSQLKGTYRKDQEDALSAEIEAYYTAESAFIESLAARYGTKLDWMKDRFHKDARYFKETRAASAWMGFIKEKFAELKGEPNHVSIHTKLILHLKNPGRNL